MKMWCKVLFLVGTTLCVMCSGFTVQAKDLSRNSESLYSSEIYELLDNSGDEVKEILDSLGLSSFSPQEVSNISISDVFSMIINFFRNGIQKPLSVFCTLLGVIIMTSVASCYISGGRYGEYFETVTVLFVSLTAFSSVSECMLDAVTSLVSVGTLVKILVPVMAGITAYSGNPALAVSYNAITLYSAEVITNICSNFLSPVLMIIGAVSVCASVNPAINVKPILNGAKKAVSLILGLSGTVFTGILAVKNVLSAGIDRVSVKGIKFILGSSVPVVGGAVSDGLASVVASVSLMKNTYGVCALIIIIAVVFPSFCNLLMWMMSLTLAGYAADSLGQNRTGEILSSLGYVLTMLFSILVFIVYISIVSTALVLLLATGQK